MGERVGELPANLDVGVLGQAMLEAACAARIGVVVTLVDLPVPLCMYVNEAAAEIVGWPVETLLREDPLSHVAPECIPMLRERFERRASGEQGEKSYEVTILRQDGRRAVIEVTASAATVNGRPAVFAFTVDVTARKEARRRRGSERRRTFARSSRSRRSRSASFATAISCLRTSPMRKSSDMQR